MKTSLIRAALSRALPATKRNGAAEAAGSYHPKAVPEAARTRARLKFFRVAACAASALLGTLAAAPAAAQTTATVITPLKSESDVNNVNMTTGLIRVGVPSLSVAAAPRLSFSSLQNAVPHLRANTSSSQSSIGVHTGASASESFRCISDACTNRKANGSSIEGAILDGGPFYFTESQTAAVYAYDSLNSDSGTSSTERQLWYYASSITYPDGEVISFTYDKATASSGTGPIHHRLTRMSSNLGYYITFGYEGSNISYPSWHWLRLATLYSSAAPSSPLGQLTYSSTGTITDLAGRVYSCSGCNNGIRSEPEWHTVSLTLPGESGAHIATTALAVPNTNKSVVSSVARDGVTWGYSYTNLIARPQPKVYSFDKVVVSGPAGYQATYNIDSSFTEGPNRLTSVVDAIGRTTSYSYDSNHRPTKVTYPEGNFVQIAYDSYGNVTSKTSQPKANSGLAAITESSGIDSTACSQNPVKCFRPTYYTDGAGRTTDYAYDNAGRLIQRTDPADANGVRRVTYLSYGSSFTAPTLVRTCGIGTTCGTGSEIRTEYTYVGSTALPATETRIDGATGTSLTTTYSYDTAGRLVTEDGPLAGTGDAKYARYDVLGRKTWEIGPANADGSRPATKTTYRDLDDKVAAVETGTVADPWSGTLNAPSRSDVSYDGRHNPTKTAVSAAGGTVHKVQSASYDDRGQQICSTVRMNAAAFGSLPADACALSAQGSHGPDRITRNVYDAAGQLLQVQKAYGTSLQENEATYTYSSNGRKTSITDANGNVAAMRYDGFDRQNRWVFPSKTSTGALNEGDYEAYGYDAAGNRTSLRKRDGVTLTYQYDGLDRVTVKSVPASASGASGYSVHYGYDVRGLQTYARFGSASGQGVTNAYDGFGRATSSTTNMGGFSRSLSYQFDAASNRTRVTHPDGNWFGYSHDNAGRIVTAGLNQASGLASFQYDAFGRRSVRSSGGTTSYGYDGIDRLTSLQESLTGGTGSVTSTFAHNPASQIVTQTRDNDSYAFTGHYNLDRSYGVNGLNQYTSAGPASFSYDANGNLTGDGSRTYVYDAENRLVSASGGVALNWDPLGRLFQTSGGSAGTTQFLYDGDALVAEYDGSGGLLRRYMHGAGPDEPLAWYEGSGFGSARLLKGDHQGSIVAMSDGNGYQFAINRYDEYGIPGSTNLGRFQYTGQASIPELGMYHYKARIYSPTLGRFLQTDPIGYDDQINLYAYVGNDPVNSTDPTGQESVFGWIADSAKMVYNELADLGEAISEGDFEYAFGGMPPTFGGGVLSTTQTVARTAARTGAIAQDMAVTRAAARELRSAASVTSRTTRHGERAITVTMRDGRVKDISPSRVKEWAPNTHAKAPPGSMQRVKFRNAIKGTKGHKRSPTVTEERMLKVNEGRDACRLAPPICELKSGTKTVI